MTSTDDYSIQIERLRDELDEADAVLIGGGSGLSTSAGLTYSGKRFEENFSDFISKYGFRDMYSAGFIHIRQQKNIGHTGADTSTSTDMTNPPGSLT